jgi:hypothetical protein
MKNISLMKILLKIICYKVLEVIINKVYLNHASSIRLERASSGK